MSTHTIPVTVSRRAAVSRSPLAVENDNGCCRCNGGIHTWGDASCDAYSRGER